MPAKLKDLGQSAGPAAGRTQYTSSTPFWVLPMAPWVRYVSTALVRHLPEWLHCHSSGFQPLFGRNCMHAS